MKQNNRQKPPSVSTSPLCAGTVHDTVPVDLRKALLADASALRTWNDITPLARNEWICWVESPKSIETRIVTLVARSGSLRHINTVPVVGSDAYTVPISR